MQPICDCKEAKKLGKKITTLKYKYRFREVVPVDDCCPYCGYYVHWNYLGDDTGLKRSTEDDDEAYLEDYTLLGLSPLKTGILGL